MIVFRRANQRLPDEGTLPPPCTWDYAVREMHADGRFFADSGTDLANTTCGYGHTARLNARVHTVAADGVITPSYSCPSTGCTYHVHPVQLEGWDPSHVFETRVID
jgi:hypothetical protein